MQRKPRFWGYLLRIINLLFVLALVLSYLSLYISPQKFASLAFFGLAYPFILGVNIFFVVWWLIRRRWFFLLSLVSILLAFQLPSRYLGIGKNVDYAEQDQIFKVISYNVHDFDYYAQNYGTQNEAFDTITSFIKKERADVVAFQEFYSHDSNVDRFTWLKLRTRAKYPFAYRHKYNQHSKKMYVALMSKHPIINKGVVEIAPDNIDITGIYADINIRGTIVRFYTVHLASMRITSESQFLERTLRVSSEEEAKEAASGLRRILSSMKTGFQKRANQVEVLKKHIEASPYPVVLMGDFNDTPVSYSYQQLTDELKDSYVEAGNGLSNTYNGRWPSFRIDYVLYDEHFEAVDYQRTKLNASDHFPVKASLRIKHSQHE